MKTSTLDPTGREAASIAEQLKLNIKDQQDVLGPKLQEQNADSRLFVVTSSLIVLVIAVVFAGGIAKAITRPIQDAVRTANILSTGDLTTKINATSQDETGKLMAALAKMVEKIAAVITKVNSTSISLSSSSRSITMTADKLNNSATKQAQQVQEAKQSIAQITELIAQTSKSALKTQNFAQQAVNDALNGGQSVDETVDAMKQIASKITVIDDIAYQTNLLALNATIEASRAGEYGKGFAVVAAEIRKLSERSQAAAENIELTAKNSVAKAEVAGGMLKTIVDSISKTLTQVEEISRASEKQSKRANLIHDAMFELNDISQANVESSLDLLKASGNIKQLSEQLNQRILFFRLGKSY